MSKATVLRLTIVLIYALLHFPMQWLLSKINMPPLLQVGLLLGIFMVVDALITTAYNCLQQGRLG